MKKRAFRILALVCVLALVCSLTGCGKSDADRYADARKLLSKGKYDEALTAFTELGPYEDSAKYVQYIKAIQLAESGKYDLALNAFVNYVGDFEDSAERIIYYTARSCEEAGDYVSASELYAQIPLTLDSAERYEASQNFIQYLETVKAMAGSVAAGDWHTVGLKSDGTVVAVGDNEYGQCDVGGWKDIVAVAAGDAHTVGLKSDGTVVAVGWNDDGQCDVGGWKDIVAVAAGDLHTVGLKSDGTVVAVGENDDGQCKVSRWHGIGRQRR